MSFTLIEFINDYVRVNDKYENVTIKKKYEMDSWDDLQNLLLTLIDFSTKTIKFEVRKEATNEQ